MELIEDFEANFEKYALGFQTHDEDLTRHVLLKVAHTERVRREILHIGKSLGLEESDLLIADIAALFHDIGRFEQYARYRTYVDSQSEDHARLSEKILRENCFIEGLDHDTREIVLFSIRCHNRLSLPEKSDERLLLFAKLLRDADKLDIFFLVTDQYRRNPTQSDSAVDLGFPDGDDVSSEVLEDLRRRRIVDFRHVRNRNDFKLLQAGWAFERECPETLRRRPVIGNR